MRGIVETRRIPQVDQFRREVDLAARFHKGDEMALSRFYYEQATIAGMYAASTPDIMQRNKFKEVAKKFESQARQHKRTHVQQAAADVWKRREMQNDAATVRRVG